MINTDESGAIYALSSRGFETEASSTENREPTLTISGTLEINQTTMQCRAVNINDIIQRCDSDVVTVTFYCKAINKLMEPLLVQSLQMQVLPQYQLT